VSLPVAILAGGLGTRLRPITETIPKVLVEVAGKSFAVHQIELLRSRGIREIIFCVGHLGEKVKETLADGSFWGVHLDYVFDGPLPLGTGGALRKALPLLGEAFFVMYGDSYLECDYSAIEQAFWANGKLGLMTIYRNNDRWDLSNVIFRQGRIVSYDKKHRTPDMQYIDYGLGILKARALETYPDGQPLDLADVYKALIRRDQLAGYEVTQRFYEIGSPAGLEETRHYLSQKEAAKDELRPELPG
jgi:NDP-sugar pyrophosphorylase family protein